ncbi:MAG: hypothetical protein FWG63_09990 [Defluviitaleaceae bacterium]|nr:hypothetical protein [Defluviitaleaceae bacterium]
MLTYDEAKQVLTQIVDTLPEEIFKELNGGIILLEDTIEDENEFLILGQYHVEYNGLGRYITIHYGSMTEAFQDATETEFIQELTDVLKHELIHHIEDLAGDRSLEIQDEIDIAEMLKHMDTE